MTPFAHVGPVPVEEWLGFAPALLPLAGAAVALLAQRVRGLLARGRVRRRRD